MLEFVGGIRAKVMQTTQGLVAQAKAEESATVNSTPASMTSTLIDTFVGGPSFKGRETDFYGQPWTIDVE
jgi:hypothetical protein